jgi:hypothetical protein
LVTPHVVGVLLVDAVQLTTHDRVALGAGAVHEEGGGIHADLPLIAGVEHQRALHKRGTRVAPADAHDVDGHHVVHVVQNGRQSLLDQLGLTLPAQPDALFLRQIDAALEILVYQRGVLAETVFDLHVDYLLRFPPDKLSGLFALQSWLNYNGFAQ